VVIRVPVQLGRVGRDGGMQLQMRDGSRIENPREYEVHAVEDLRDLLLAGSQAQPDPHRENFYQIEHDKNAYYIHVSPITGNVILLAKWARQPQPCYADAAGILA
jgi:hypothetical protein